MNKKLIALGAVALGAIAIIGVSDAFAATKIGTVTGKDGDIRDRVSINAEVVSSEGSHLTIKDTETGSTYDAAIGPKWYSGSYEAGDTITVEGVITDDENKNGHTFQAMKINDKILRENFESKPSWAGTRGQNKGQGNKGENRNGNFVDANGDGKCDNQAS